MVFFHMTPGEMREENDDVGMKRGVVGTRGVGKGKVNFTHLSFASLKALQFAAPKRECRRCLWAQLQTLPVCI